MEAKTKVTLERAGIWVGIAVALVGGPFWLGGLQTQVNAADQTASTAAVTAQNVSQKIAALDERTIAIQNSLQEIKAQQTQQAADAAAAQREIIKALRERRGN